MFFFNRLSARGVDTHHGHTPTTALQISSCIYSITPVTLILMHEPNSLYPPYSELYDWRSSKKGEMIRCNSAATIFSAMRRRMRCQDQLLLLPLLLCFPGLLLFIFPITTYAKTTIEACGSSDSCPSLLSYLVPYDSKLSEIAYRFQLNISDILAANSISQTTTSPGNSQIFLANSLVKLPISCPCVDGIRRSTSTTYTVRASDTVDSISEAYGGLVSAEQIRSSNGISARNPLTSGQILMVPLPCTCFNNSDDGVATVYMSYVVQRGESLDSIAMEFGTTVKDLETVNELGETVIDPGDILAVPISACSTINLNWYNESLLVPNGSYALTANNCIKCICGPSNLHLHCVPSGLLASCSHLQCKGSDLFIGEAYVKNTTFGCDITSCLYRGHLGSRIFRSIVNSSHVQCPGNQSYDGMSPTASPSSHPAMPSKVIPPFLAPYPAPRPTMGKDGGSSFSPANEHNPNISSREVKSLQDRSSWFSLLLLEVLFNIML